MLLNSVSASTSPFQLNVGDLLFQDLNCGVLCNGIGEVTEGVHHTYVSHVGMVESIQDHRVIVIEAIGNGVVETPLDKFLARSDDRHGGSMVMVGRLKPFYRSLIPSAVSYAKKQLGKPYNASFSPNARESFYCSQLIYSAFAYANHNEPIFRLNKMNFEDVKTQKIMPAWKIYFEEIHAAPPQGLLGTNPGMMSRDPAIIIVHYYGALRVHNGD
jgi:hypothetical protein